MEKGWPEEQGKDRTLEAAAAQKRALEQAEAAHRQAEARVGAMARWRGLQTLDILEQRYANGNRFALLHAINICAKYYLVIPEWARDAFIEGFSAVGSFRTNSWDDAFGRPYPKRMRMSMARRRRDLLPKVYNRVRQILDAAPGTPVSEALFEQVGDEFGIGKTLCSQLYYTMKQ